MLTTGDLEGDGFDEVLHGSYCLNGQGKLRWERIFNHPDVVEIADIRPDLPGMEVAFAIEQWGGEDKSIAVVDKDGNILFSRGQVEQDGDDYLDHGHYMTVGNFRADLAGLEVHVTFYPGCSICPEGAVYRLFDAHGNVLSTVGIPAMAYWDGSGVLTAGPPAQCYSGEAWVFHADLIGDYREEWLVMPMGRNGGNCSVHWGDVILCTNTAMNPYGKAPSPWENRQYRLDQARTGY